MLPHFPPPLIDLQYKYLTNGNVQIPGVNDAQNFAVTKQALATLGIPAQEVDAYFFILSAILHLGNIQFVSNNVSDSTTSDSPTA